MEKQPIREGDFRNGIISMRKILFPDKVSGETLLPMEDSVSGKILFFLNGTITDQSISSDPDIRLRTIMRVYCKNYELDEK